MFRWNPELTGCQVACLQLLLLFINWGAVLRFCKLKVREKLSFMWNLFDYRVVNNNNNENNNERIKLFCWIQKNIQVSIVQRLLLLSVEIRFMKYISQLLAVIHREQTPFSNLFETINQQNVCRDWHFRYLGQQKNLNNLNWIFFLCCFYCCIFNFQLTTSFNVPSFIFTEENRPFVIAHELNV